MPPISPPDSFLYFAVTLVEVEELVELVEVSVVPGQWVKVLPFLETRLEVMLPFTSAL